VTQAITTYAAETVATTLPPHLRSHSARTADLGVAHTVPSAAGLALALAPRPTAHATYYIVVAHAGGDLPRAVRAGAAMRSAPADEGVPEFVARDDAFTRRLKSMRAARAAGQTMYTEEEIEETHRLLEAFGPLRAAVNRRMLGDE